MRNVVLAGRWVSRSDVDDATVALCAPRAHHAIWRRWDEARAHLAAAGTALADIPAEVVVSSHASGTPLAERYLLDLRAEE